MSGHSDRDHAPFSPSAAERWLACPMAVRYAEQLPPKAASKDSDWGTRCHELSEKALRAGWDDIVLGAAALEAARGWIEQWDIIDETPGDVAEEMRATCRLYIDYITSRTVDGVERRLEERVTVVGKDCWGSLDCSLYAPFDYLEIVDLKGGKGKCVDPEDNEQLLTYAVGEAIRLDWAFDRVLLTIVQPRRSDGKAPILTWECTPDRLRQHHKAIKAAIKASKSIDAKPVAGSYCDWCVAKALCPAQRERALSVLDADPADAPIINLPQPGALTPEQLSRVLQHRKAIEKWFEACGALALTQPPPGWKLVEGSSKRKWCSPEDAHATLVIEGLDADAFHTLKLIGLKEAEALLKKANRMDLAEVLFVKPKGKPTVAPMNDPRPPLDPLKALPDDGEDE